MNRHEGVSCDSCLKSNFNGRRYKCLICYDYDLCADCYEEGVTSTRHSVDHPMQCILTRSDIELFFGGEMLNSEQPQSFTCPYCKKMGFSDSTLLEHVSSEHTETSLEVVCPVCAGLPGGEPNLVTDDFGGHLTLEHRNGPRELLSFLDEPSAIRHGGGVRRIPGRTLGGPRSRRSNMLVNSSSGLSALSPSGRDSVDPIAELLSQLSGVRRGGGSGPQSSQLQQLQMQIQLERQQVIATRQQLERLPRRQAHPMVSSSSSNATMQEIGNGSSGTPSGSGGATGSGGCRATEWTVNNTTTSSIQQSQSNVGGGTSGSSSSTLNTREVPLNTSVLTVNDFGLSSCQFLQPAVGGSGAGNTGNTNNSDGGQNSQFLLSKFMTPSLSEDELVRLERDRADRSLYVQAMLLSTLASFKHDSEWNSNSKHKSPKTHSETLNSSNGDETTNVNSNAANSTNSANTETISDEQTVMNNNTMNRDQQQQTCPEDFVEEYSLQHQTSYNSNNAVSKKKPTSSSGKGGGVNQANANATASAMTLEKRGRPPPPPVSVGGGAGGGTQPQQGPNQQKLTREMKTTSSSMSASNEIPDSR